jgi:5-(carboxyamino)imidazole ribonucleotide mutase
MNKPQVAVIMGSNSDWGIMNPALDMLEKFGVACEARLISAHRATNMLVEYAEGLRERGFVCAIAGADGAARPVCHQHYRGD